MKSNYLFSIILLMPPFFMLSADLTPYDRSVLRAAPIPLKRIHKVLSIEKERDKYPYSCVALVGPPGVGKTSLGIALAHEAGFEPLIVSNADIACPQRDGSSDKLKYIIKDVRRSNEKTLIIFDEFNALVENFNDPTYDTGNLSKLLWGFFDDLQREKNKKIFCIATMNSIEKIPQELKTRLGNTTFNIKGITDPAHSLEILLSNVESDDIVLNKEEREYLVSQFDKKEQGIFSYLAEGRIDCILASRREKERYFPSKMSNPRALAMCGMMVRNHAYDYCENRPVTITKDLIDGALERVRETDELLQIDKEIISERERHHQESIRNSREIAFTSGALSLAMGGAQLACNLGYLENYRAAPTNK